MGSRCTIIARLGAGLGLLLLPLGCEKPPPKIPANVFFGNAGRVAYRISPDGTMLSFLQQWNGHVNLFVEPAGGGAAIQLTSDATEDIEGRPEIDVSFSFNARRVTSETERDVPPDYFWKGNRYIVFRKDNHGDEQFHFYRIDVTPQASGNRAPEDLTPFPKVRAALIDDLAGVSDSDILIRLNQRDERVFDACRLNVIEPDSQKIQIVVENTFGGLAWLADHRGCIRAAITREGTKTTLRTRPSCDGDFTPIITTEFTDLIDLQGYTADDKLLYAISNVNRDKSALVLVDPNNANASEVGAPLYENAKFDLARLVFSKKRKVPAYVTFLTAKLERKFFDKQTEAVFEALQKKLPDYVLSITDQDEAEQKFIVTASNDRTPPTFYLFDHQTNVLRRLTDVDPSLKSKYLAPMQTVEYSSNGRPIQAYLTLPLGRGKKSLPTVIYPHGGPWYRDRWGYDPEVQFLANCGYAVLQMDFRGSLGYGKSFWTSGFKEWGGKMQDDVTAGAKWLIARGTADPKRIAIYGESYGGYSALAGATFTPNLYCAAADRAGITNLLDFLSTLPPYWGFLIPELYAKVGDPALDADLLRAHSPLLHLDQITKPLLICHGRKDVRVNFNQSERLVNGLEQIGREPESLWFDNEGHEFELAAKIQFHEKLDAFLEKHLKPAPP